MNEAMGGSDVRAPEEVTLSRDLNLFTITMIGVGGMIGIVEGQSVVDTVLEQAEGCDLIVIGATDEPLFRNLLLGNAAEQIASRAEVTVILVKRRSGALHSFLRQTVLEPTTSRGTVVEGGPEGPQANGE